MATQMPYVRLKVAASLDGRTAMASGELSGLQALLHVRMYSTWRAISSAVITGIRQSLQMIVS